MERNLISHLQNEGTILRTLYFATSLRYTPGIVTIKSILPQEKTKTKKHMTKKSVLIAGPHSLLHRSGSHDSINDMHNGFVNSKDTPFVGYKFKLYHGIRKGI